MDFPNFYKSRHYKKLILVPAALMLASLALIFFNGIPSGIELKGGIRVTVLGASSVDAGLVKEKLASLSPEVSVRAFENSAGKGFEVELGNDPVLEEAAEKMSLLRNKEAALVQAELNANYLAEAAKNDSSRAGEAFEAAQKAGKLKEEVLADASALLASIKSSKSAGSDAHNAVKVADEEFNNARSAYREKILAVVRESASGAAFSVKEVGSVLSKYFFSKTQEFLLWSFLLSAIVVLIIFRSLVPSFAVIFGAFNDLVITMGAMSLFGIPLSLASVATLLMLIGFSLDTDMLLTIRVLKREGGTPQERVYGAFITGFMLNLTTIVAFGILAVVGAYLQIATYYQIGIVAVIGGVADFIATWCANAGIILWYAEKKERRRAALA
jgi:preprotein translocase subunit SecF